VAALIKDKLGFDTVLESGNRGEFSVWVDGVKVAEKSRTGFPAEPAVIEIVRKAIA
jgi:predicted Rdx family selenoprotein